MSATPRIRIGRDPKADLRFSSKTVSRWHAKAVLTSGGEVELSDDGSTNGVFLTRDGKKRSISRATLQRGDKISFGEETVDAERIVDLLRRQIAAVSAKRTTGTADGEAPDGKRVASPRFDNHPDGRAEPAPSPPARAKAKSKGRKRRHPVTNAVINDD